MVGEAEESGVALLNRHHDGITTLRRISLTISICSSQHTQKFKRAPNMDQRACQLQSRLNPRPFPNERNRGFEPFEPSQSDLYRLNCIYSETWFSIPSSPYSMLDFSFHNRVVVMGVLTRRPGLEKLFLGICPPSSI